MGCGIALVTSGLSLTADAAANAPSPHAASLPLIMCELLPLHQQFMALVTTHRQYHWPGLVESLLLLEVMAFQRVSLSLAVQHKAAKAAGVGAGGSGGQRAAAGAWGGAFGADGEDQALPAGSNEDSPTSRAWRQLAASPALWAAAWAQLAAFCQGMYTWQYGKPKKTRPSESSSSSMTNRNSSSSSSKSGSRSSNVAGSSDLAGIVASLQLCPDHEQVAALFDPREFSARVEALGIPAKGRPFLETALAHAVGFGFSAPTAFVDTVLTCHGMSILCEGVSLQQGARGSKGPGSRGGENSGGTGRGDRGSSSSGRGEGSSSSGRGEGSSSSGRGEGSSSSGRGEWGSSSSSTGGRGEGGSGSSSGGRGEGGSGSSSSGGSSGGGDSSNANTRAAESSSRTLTGSTSSGEDSSCSSDRLWSESIGGLAPAAGLQLMLEAAALLWVADRHKQSSAAVTLLCTMAKHCSFGPRKCFLSARGGCLLDMLTAAARSYPRSDMDVADLINIFVDGSEEGEWVYLGVESVICQSLALIVVLPVLAQMALSYRHLAADNLRCVHALH